MTVFYHVMIVYAAIAGFAWLAYSAYEFTVKAFQAMLPKDGEL